MDYKKTDFKSTYFDLFELTEGIYAAMAKKDSGTSVSTGFFDLGNYLIIFDTNIYPGAARDLYKAAKQLYDKDPIFIINSHHHSDHYMGNCLFPDTIPIISTPITLKAIKEEATNQLKHYQETAEVEIKKRKEMLQEENPEWTKREINNDLEFYKYIVDPTFKIRYPNFLINDELIIKGGKKTVHLIPFGVGHTNSDIVAYFPNEKICFMGDLLFANLEDDWAPDKKGTFNAVNPPKLYDILKSLMEKDIEIYIPGHGELNNTKEALQMNMDFIKKYYL